MGVGVLHYLTRARATWNLLALRGRGTFTGRIARGWRRRVVHLLLRRVLWHVLIWVRLHLLMVGLLGVLLHLLGVLGLGLLLVVCQFTGLLAD